MRHLRRFHPQVELAYAAAFSLGSGVPEEAALQGASGAAAGAAAGAAPEDDDDVEDENNAASRNGPTAVGPTKSKGMRIKEPGRCGKSFNECRFLSGGQHPCNLCGKVFGRRYHLVRHRRTQHGIECSKSGRVGRPPKKPLGDVGVFSCAACKAQFASTDDFQGHSCQDNNNGEGSSRLAEPRQLRKDKPFDCTSCGESFDKQKELHKHVETHVQDLMKDMLWT